MMDLTEAKMTDSDDMAQSSGRSLMWIILSTLGIVMAAGAIAGYMAEHSAQGGGPLGTPGIIALTVFGAMIAGLAYLAWFNGKKLKQSGGALTNREKLNRNIMLGCGISGGAIGMFLAFYDVIIVGSEPSALAVLSDSPIAPAIAILLAFFWAVIIPIVAWFWHKRVIDEQEASAYRDGGYYSAYAYLIGAPTWWILWRGGFAPEPDGPVIFMLFALSWSAIWLWKKYN